MELSDQGFGPAQEDSFQVLWKNEQSTRKVVHALLNGKHIDPYLSEEFRFLESYPAAWEMFFERLGYRIRRSETGGSPFYFLESRTELANQVRLSRGATFLGLYMAWHFFMEGPGEAERISAEEIFRLLVTSYPFQFLRSIFVRRITGASQMELSEDQAEKLRGAMRKELAQLAKYRFIDVKPNVRASWEDLIVHRLPALHRFWELALHVHADSGNGSDADIGRVVTEVWGSLDSEIEEDEL